MAKILIRWPGLTPLLLLTACASQSVHSLLGREFHPLEPGPQRTKQEKLLDEARAAYAADPGNPDKLIWIGRRLGYLGRIPEAIAVFSDGIRRNPDYAPQYRHRGHRYITMREFARAQTDLETAARLMRDRPDEIEPDGLPNAKNIPLTTLDFNIWYHLGLARYLQEDFDGALAAWQECMNYLGGYDDNLVAVLDWMYMSLRRMGRDAEAASLLERVRPDMEMLENTAYLRRLLMYKGLLRSEELLSPTGASDLDIATYGYGVGNWYFYNGKREQARGVFERVVAGKSWQAFGFIAAEVDLARAGKRVSPN